MLFRSKAGVAILISEKIGFKIKAITRDKEGHYIMIKGSIQEEDRTIVNIYAPNIGAPQYIRQMPTAIKGEIDSNTIMVGDFNTPLSPMDRSSKMKINKELTSSAGQRHPNARIPHPQGERWGWQGLVLGCWH